MEAGEKCQSDRNKKSALKEEVRLSYNALRFWTLNGVNSIVELSVLLHIPIAHQVNV